MNASRTHARSAPSTLDFEPFDFDERFGNAGLDLDALSDTELEDLLFRDDAAPPSGLWNLPTLTGLSLVGVGVAYLLQQFDLWNGVDLTVLVNMLPVLSGILIILVGMGVLSWRPRKRHRVKKKRRGVKAWSKLTSSEETTTEEAAPSDKKRLRKSKHDRKLMGVCGGIAEYLNLDPTLVRIAFIIGLVVSEGAVLLAYFALAYALPKPETLSPEERMRIIRES